MTDKVLCSFRLDGASRRAIGALSKRLNIARTEVVRRAIMDYDRRLAPSTKTKPTPRTRRRVVGDGVTA